MSNLLNKEITDRIILFDTGSFTRGLD